MPPAETIETGSNDETTWAITKLTEPNLLPFTYTIHTGPGVYTTGVTRTEQEARDRIADHYTRQMVA